MTPSAQTRTVDVDVKPRGYPVIIGPGELSGLGQRLAESVPAKRAMIITDTNVGPLYGDQARVSLESAGFEVHLVTVEAGEPSKSLEVASRLWDECAAAKLDRTSTLVSLGGGVVGDLTGFIAASWMRGIHFVQCSTTVEADVDASVGGKTAVNHSSGKNMIGAFYQPRFVIIDTATLSTLSERDYLAGLAESIKHAVIRDTAFFDWHEANTDAIRSRDASILPELIEHNVRIKAAVVAEDEREVTGVRALLNFGHTIGHAIETLMSRREKPWRHGEAVAVGMVAACEMSVVSGRLQREAAERIIRLIEKTNLPVEAPLAHAHDDIMQLMRLDKKVAAGRIRFVLADAIGQAKLYDDIEPAWIEAGLNRVLQ